MGQFVSSGKDLRCDRFYIRGEVMASKLGFDSFDLFKHALESRKDDMSKLAREIGSRTSAELLGTSRVGTIGVTAVDIPNIMSFGDMIRPVSQARVQALSDSYYTGGIILNGGSSGGNLTCALDFHPDGKKVSGMIAWCIDFSCVLRAS